MPAYHHLIVTCPLYCEELVQTEIEAIGLTDVKIHHGAVKAKGTLEHAYRICLWSRVANKVLFPLLEFEAESKEELLTTLTAFPFSDHFSVAETFAVESQISHTFFPNPNIASLVVKDAVVDSFRRRFGKRPNVDTRRPDVRLDLFLEDNKGMVSVELAAQGLFKRAYRQRAGDAPLKENVAAAILLRAGWREIAAQGGPLIDLMCGSGTFLFEGLLIAADIAPGSLTETAGPEKWMGHDKALWRKLLEEAAGRKRKALSGRLPTVLGYDVDAAALENSTANLREAGLLKYIHVKRSDFRSVRPPEGVKAPGLVVANPPYGKRLGGGADVSSLYGDLGRFLSEAFDGYKAAVLAGDRELARAVGLRAEKLHTIYNGPIRCTLAHFNLSPANKYRPPRGKKT
jgi:23S rRNA (guanine2445-N2)-methyltransferase / 23S rRNA (guanine2069-N7)-methyltransferase